MSDIAKKLDHNLILNNRSSASLSGVTQIGSFDEHTVVLYTDYGEVTVSGSELNMSKLSVDTGDVDVSGVIKSIVYSDNGPKKESLIKRIFK